MSKEKVKKVMKVQGVHTLTAGAEIELADFQISASNADGTISMVNATIEEEATSKRNREGYVIKPGAWRVTPENGIVELDLCSSPELFFETDTSRELMRHITAFKNKLSVYEKYNRTPKRGILLGSEPGCFAKGTKVIKHNGNIANIEDIKVGDFLMGPDNTPREVLRLVRGRDRMMRVIPRKGNPFIVNENHQQCFYRSHEKVYITARMGDVATEDFSKTDLKIFRATEIQFPPMGIGIHIPPYILGLWLGDGKRGGPTLTSMDSEVIDAWSEYGKSLGCAVTKNKNHGINGKENRSSNYSLTNQSHRMGKGKESENLVTRYFRRYGFMMQGDKKEQKKWIPVEYKTASVQDRLDLLAGIVDTDGEVSGKTESAASAVIIASKWQSFAEDIAFLARSLGFAAYIKPRSCGPSGHPMKSAMYYYVYISGDLSRIPLKIERKKVVIVEKRKQIKSVSVTGFRTEYLPEDDYYGFTIDKDHLFLLDDFTVVHNCGKTATITHYCKLVNQSESKACILRVESDVDWEILTEMFMACDRVGAVDYIVLVIEDIGGSGLDQKADRVNAGMLNFLSGNDVFMVPTLILATTNYLGQLGNVLLDRPGRFDAIIQLKPPADSDVFIIVGSTLGRELTDEEKKALSGTGFPPSYCVESIIRSEIYDVTLSESIEELKAQRQEVKKRFEKSNSMGFTRGDDDD